MARRNYERLSALDAAFLAVETSSATMNIGGTLLLAAAPLRTADGGIDIDRIRAHIGTRLHRLPRYRQRLAFVPVVNRPVWVDDAEFDLGYHVRHVSLPRPGDQRQLRRLAAQILAAPLDRERPLWEVWVVEGLRDGHFALVTKVHHCMADGISGAEFLAAILDTSVECSGVADGAGPWKPRPAPSPLALLEDEVRRRAGLPFLLARRLERALGDPDRLRRQIEDGFWAVRDLIAAAARPRRVTPLNQAIGRQRRLEWLAVELDDVQAIRNRLGGSINDVVLTIVAGGLQRFFDASGVGAAAGEVRAAVPVNVRRSDERGRMGNRISVWLVPLPVQEADARRRYEFVRDTTANLKATRQARGGEVLGDLAEFAGMEIIAVGAQVAVRVPTHHLVVSNVPGPPVPLYLLGAPMTAGYPLVPLFPNQALGIAVFSYAGKLHWGLNADWKTWRNLGDLATALRESFAELRKLAARVSPRSGAAADSPAGSRQGRRPSRVAYRRSNPRAVSTV